MQRHLDEGHQCPLAGGVSLQPPGFWRLCASSLPTMASISPAWRRGLARLGRSEYRKQIEAEMRAQRLLLALETLSGLVDITSLSIGGMCDRQALSQRICGVDNGSQEDDTPVSSGTSGKRGAEP
jgi:hypothetical protein